MMCAKCVRKNPKRRMPRERSKGNAQNMCMRGAIARRNAKCALNRVKVAKEGVLQKGCAGAWQNRVENVCGTRGNGA